MKLLAAAIVALALAIVGGSFLVAQALESLPLESLRPISQVENIKRSCAEIAPPLKVAVKTCNWVALVGQR